MTGPTKAEADAEAGDEGLPPERRVRKRWEHREVARRGKRIHTPHYVLIVLPRPGASSRLGITVTKKVSPAAVSRNRIKRVLREVFRRNPSLFPSAADVVVIAKTGAEALSYDAARAELAGVSRTLHRTAARGS